MKCDAVECMGDAHQLEQVGTLFTTGMFEMRRFSHPLDLATI